VAPDAIWDGEWSRSRDGCIIWGGDRRREGAVLGVNLGRPTVPMGTLRRGSSQLLWAGLVLVIGYYLVLEVNAGYGTQFSAVCFCRLGR